MSKNKFRTLESISNKTLTPFGVWLGRYGIAYLDAATELGKTRSYMQMLATGRATPQLSLAYRIEQWTKKLMPSDYVSMQSWGPYLDVGKLAA